MAITVAVRRRRRRSPSVGAWGLLAPGLALIGVFIAIPVGTVFYLSFQNQNLSEPYYDGFAGVSNFVRLLTADPAFWRSLGVTAVWVIVEVGLQLVLGLMLALLLNRTFRGRGLTRALMFAPWAISGVLATEIWLLIYQPDTGIASVIDLFGGHSGITPLGSATGAFASAIVAELWRGLPFFAIMLLADLQSIPREVFEAADVDGASPFQRLRYVTLPYLKNAIVITTLLRAVWEFNNVDLIYTLTSGGPAGATTTLPLYIVNEAVNNRDFGYGSALTVAGFIVLAAFSVLYLVLSRSSRREAL